MPGRQTSLTSVFYHSTNNPSHKVDLKEAILRSLPPDNGLYMPDALPVLGDDFWKIWRHLSFTEIGISVADAFFGEDVPVRARIHTINGFSAHADQAELLAWHRQTRAELTFLVHGDPEAMDVFAKHLEATRIERPELNQEVEL